MSCVMFRVSCSLVFLWAAWIVTFYHDYKHGRIFLPFTYTLICFLFTFAFSSRVAAKQVSHFSPILSHIIAFNGKCILLYSFTEVSYLTVFLFVRLVSLDNPSISFLMLGLFYEITVSVFNFWEKYWMYFLENLVHGFVVTVHDLILTGDRRRRRSCQVNLGHKIFRPHFETNNHSHSH